MADRDQIDKTIDAYLASFTALDRDAWLACFGPDAWIEDPIGSELRRGRDGIAAFWDEIHVIPDSIELWVTGPRVIVGHEAVLNLEARPSLGGDTYALDVVDVITFDDDARITSFRAFYESGSLRPLYR
jgi:steroid delta-isomerase